MFEETVEFMKLETMEKAEVVTEMVVELSKETGLYLEICMRAIAEYKNWSMFQVERYVKMYDPDLYYLVAYFEGEKRVYKSQVDKEVKNIIKEKLEEVILSHPYDASIKFIRNTIREFCYQGVKE